MGAGKNVGNRLYINFGTASRFGPLFEALRKSGTEWKLQPRHSAGAFRRLKRYPRLQFTRRGGPLQLSKNQPEPDSGIATMVALSKSSRVRGKAARCMLISSGDSPNRR